jgi:hypothetical protein
MKQGAVIRTENSNSIQEPRLPLINGAELKRRNTSSLNESDYQHYLEENCEHKNANEEILIDSEEEFQPVQPLIRFKTSLDPYVDIGCNSPKTMRLMQ